MKSTYLRLITMATAGAVMLALGCSKEPTKARVVMSEAKAMAASAGPVTAGEAREIAVEAYIYGYPLVTMEMTRRVMTNVATPQGKYAPMGQIANLRTYPSPADKDVTAPNADTLYSLAWVNVSKEPYVLSIPEAKGRYYLMPMLDGWTNVFEDPGKRTTGTGPQTYAITGPGWKGVLPLGVKEYKSPTGLVWILGRTYCTGTAEDYAAVHVFQDKLSLVPLSAYGTNWTPPVGKVDLAVDMTTPIREQVNAMGTEAYFDMLAMLMKDNMPSADDTAIVAKMIRIGLVPGQRFSLSKFDPDVARNLAGVPQAGFEKIMASYSAFGKKVNGWSYSTDLGVYGKDYLGRALTTAVGLGANRPQDAIYPVSEIDSAGKPYDGAYKYVLHFDKGQAPPVNAFWSLTMYDSKLFFVPNALNRYTLSPRNALKYESDGSLNLYVQHESPGAGRESNWLPAAEGKFVLMLRLYWPKEGAPSIVNGTWQPPPVTQVE